MDLISAVRLHRTEDAVRKLQVPVLWKDGETHKQRRRRLLSEKQFELQRSTVSLSNKEWQQNTGRLLHRARIGALSKSKRMETAYTRLAASSSRTGFVVDYMHHVQARLETASDVQSWMQIKMIRRWKFESYQKEQRVITKLATSLFGGL